MRRTGRGLVMLVSAWLPSVAWASGPAIQLPDSEIGRALGVLAEKELGSSFVVYAPIPAALRVAVEQRDEHLIMVVTGEDDGVWAERRFALPRTAALRAAIAAIQHARLNYETSTTPAPHAAVTATVSAAKRPQSDGRTRPNRVTPGGVTPRRAIPEDPPTAPTAEATATATRASSLEPNPDETATAAPPDLADESAAPQQRTKTATTTTGLLHVSAQAALAFNHNSPALGFQIRAQAHWERLQAGFLFTAYGLGCCRRSVQADNQTALEGTPRAIDLLANIDLEIVNLDSLALGVSAAGGAEQLHISVTPVIFAGPAPVTTTSRWSPLARLGLWGGGPLLFDWLRWRADLGLQLRFRSAAVGLPQGFPAQSEPLTMGRFVPLVALGLEGLFF